MDVLQVVLLIATLLCSLVAGFLFCYEIVIMPGINNLDDADFIRAFQVTDGVIQKNQPLFIFVWLGSALFLLASTALGVFFLDGGNLTILLIATVAYIAVVQITTILIHLPLNKQLQQLDVKHMSNLELRQARQEFEPHWNRSNRRRTAIACAVSALLMLLLVRL